MGFAAWILVCGAGLLMRNPFSWGPLETQLVPSLTVMLTDPRLSQGPSLGTTDSVLPSHYEL